MNQFDFKLPTSDHTTSITFGEATSEQIVSCRKLAGAEFSKPLTRDDYVEQENYLKQKPLAKDGGLRVWCLSLTHDPSQVLATCKTIPRELLIRRVGGTSRQRAYCIASVVTNPQYRGLGLASRLLEFVAEWLDGPGDAVASVLYTSIGDFYHRRGWKMMPASQASLSWPSSFSPSVNRNQLPETRLISGKEVPELCIRDVRDVESYFEKLTPQPNESRVCVLPTSNLITWLQDRSDFVCTKMKGGPPKSHGTICESADTWLYWFHDFRKQQLAVQRARIPVVASQITRSVLAAMLLDAIEEAHMWNLPKIILWDPCTELLGAMSILEERFNVKVEMLAVRNKSVPSMRWKHADEENTTIFHFNEFYTWS
ncbi:hypothetical protein F5Y10DRAFT_279330 [Nemania abortiva]|nr:hypothetical protein F5Y10DRAFT_279330 [Nemania abortiva]